MTHRNAPLTPEGRRRAVEEVLDRGRPVSHVAGEFRISRTTLSKWVGRYRAHGPAGLEDASSAPADAGAGLGCRAHRVLAAGAQVDCPPDRSRAR